jgi:hypothetical protein
LPPELQARIADYVGSDDRKSMRLMSKENHIIYNTRPERAFNVRQRLTMVDLQTGQVRYFKTPSSLITKNPFSLEIGTTEQVKEVLNLVNVETEDVSRQNADEPPDPDDDFFLGGWFHDFIDQDGQENGSAFKQLTEFLTMDAAGAGHQLYADFTLNWPQINYDMTKRMFVSAFSSLEQEEPVLTPFNYSLFTVKELRNLIRDCRQFPTTFVKVREINLLDYATIYTGMDEEDEVKVKNILDLVAYMHSGPPEEEAEIPEADDQGLRTLLTRFLGGDGNTTLEGLRPQARYRYIHEINVDYVVSDQPLSFPLLPEASESMEEEGGSASAAMGSSGSSGGGKRKRGQ